MATKAELAAELALLKQKQAERDTEAEADPQPDDPAPQPDWAATLAGLGVDISDPEAMLKQLTGEMNDLAHEKPLLTAGAAFALGFALGRMSK